MDVERLVVTLLADASRYNAVLSYAEISLVRFAENVTSTMAKAAVSLATQFERAAIAFEVMTGNAETGMKTLNDLIKMATETPFHSTELIKAGKMLAAFGFEAQEIIPTLHALGEASSATGTPIDRITLAFGQVRTAGRLLGQELRQFTNAGIPMAEMLAAVTGKPTEVIRKMVREGQIGFPEVVAAFNKMTQAGGLYAGMMDRINKETVSGRWENFTENLQVAARNFGLAAFEGLGLKQVLGDLTKLMDPIVAQPNDKDKFSPMQKSLMKYFEVLREFGKELFEGAKRLADWIDRNQEVIKVVGGVIAAMMVWTVVLRLVAAALALVRLTVVSTLSPFKLLTLVLAAVTFGMVNFEKETTEGAVKAIQDWIKNNEELIGRLGELVLAVAAAVAMIRVLVAAVVAGQIIVAFLSTVNIYAVAAVLAVAALLVVYGKLGAFDGVLKELGKGWKELSEAFSAGGEGIVAALRVGDLKVAWDIAMASLELGWAQLLVNMEAAWVKFTHNLPKALDTAQTSIAEHMLGGSLRVDRALLDTKKALGQITPKEYEEQMVEVEKHNKQLLANLKEDSQNIQRGFKDVQDSAVMAVRTRNQENIDRLAKRVKDLAEGAKTEAFMTDILGGKAYREIERLAPPSVMRLLRPEDDPATALMKELEQLEKILDVRKKIVDLAERRIGKEGTPAAVEAFTDALRKHEEARDAIAKTQETLATSQAGKAYTVSGLPLPNVSAGFMGLGGGMLLGGVHERTSNALADAANAIRDLRAGRAAGKSPEEMQALADKVKETTEVFTKLSDVVSKVGVKLGPGMFSPFSISPKAREAAEKLQLEFAKGTGPASFFATRMDQYLEAYRGAPGQAALAAAGGFPVTAAKKFTNLGGKGILNIPELDFGLFSNYEDMLKHNKGNNAFEAPTVYSGSQAAADIIGKNQNQTMSVQEEVLKQLRYATTVEEEQREYLRQVVEALKSPEAQPLVERMRLNKPQ